MVFCNEVCCVIEAVRYQLSKVKVKVKCTVVQAQRLCTGCRVHRGSSGIGKGKVHRCTGTAALYRQYSP